MNPIQNPNPGTSTVELALRDIHLPDGILWWPLAPGWWILFLLFLFIVLCFFVYKKTWYKRKVKKNIKLELEHYYQEFKVSGNAQSFIQQLSGLLRRVSLYRFHEDAIAKLLGIEWLEFLDSKLPNNQSEQLSFKVGVGKIFLSGPYQPIINEDVSPVYKLVDKWLNYNLKNKYGF